MIRYLLLAPVFSFTVALAAHLIHAELACNIILEMTFVLWLGVSIGLGWTKRKEISAKLMQGMTVVSLLLALYWDSLFAIPGEVVGSFIYRLIGTICLNASVLIWGAAWLKNRKQVKNLQNMGIYLLFAAVFMVLSWETLDDWYRWDSYYYVSQLGYATTADFTLNHLGSMNLVNHLCSVYSMLALTLSTWLGDISLGARLLNWILAFGAAVCFYRLLRAVLPEKKRYAIVSTLIYIASPWVSGFIGEVSLDYVGFCALMMLFWYVYDNNVIMAAAAASLLVFSKEPGVVVCGAVALTLWIQSIYHQRKLTPSEGVLRAGWKAIWSGRVLALGIPMVLWLMQYVRLSHWGAFDSTHFFGFSSGFLKQKIPTILTLNFTWLVLGMMGLACIALKYKKNGEKLLVGWLSPILAGTGAFLLFDVIFVTFNHARYNLLLVPGLFVGLFFYYGKSGLLEKTWGKMLLGTMGIVLCIQTFWQIDPISKWVERDITIGNSTIVSTNWNSGVNNFGDAIVSNRQYTYFDEAIDKVLEEIDYEEGKAVVLPGCFHLWQGVEPEYIYYGIMGDYAFRNKDIYWDAEKKERNFECGELLKIYVMTEDFVLQDVPEQLYYISVPWYEDDTELLNEYVIQSKKIVSYRGWEITIYELGEKIG